MLIKVVNQNILHNGRVYSFGEEVDIEDDIAENLCKVGICYNLKKPYESAYSGSYEKLKKDELIALAMDFGIEVSDKMNKSEIIELITEADDGF